MESIPSIRSYLSVVGRTDYIMYVAVAMLPVYGTDLGLHMPYWTSISSWLFIIYAELNWRLLSQYISNFEYFYISIPFGIRFSLWMAECGVPLGASFLSIVEGSWIVS